MPRKKKEEKVVEFPVSKKKQETQITIPKMPVEIVDVGSVEALSIEAINKRKAELRAQREKIMLSVDESKLKQARKVVMLMDNTLDQMSSILLSGEPDSRAFKEYAEAYDRLVGRLSSLTRLDTDLNGEYKEIHLTIRRE